MFIIKFDDKLSIIIIVVIQLTQYPTSCDYSVTLHRNKYTNILHPVYHICTFL